MTSLLSVVVVLPPELRDLPHVVDLVTNLLMPETIDAAVYNDLQRVIREYGEVRPWTIGAMDGAAVRGRLDILQWLHTNRTEGCSVEAFTGAVINSHVHVLQWLCSVYPDMFDRTRELTTAVRHRQPDVVGLLRAGVEIANDMGPFLQTAAELGFADVFERLLPGPRDMTEPYQAAVGNGHAQVVQVLLDRCPRQILYRHEWSLETAVENDYLGLAEVLLGRCDQSTAHSATEQAMRIDTLLAMGAIKRLFLAAVKKGSVEMVKLLAEQVATGFDKALEVAVSNGHLNVVEVLLEICKAGKLKGTNLYYYIARAAAKAVSARKIEIAKLLAKNCRRYDGSKAMMEAVRLNDLESVKLFVTKSKRSSIGCGISYATRNSQTAIVNVLLEHSDQKTIQQALTFSSDKKTKVAKVLLEKSDPAACASIFTKAAADGRTGLMEQMLDTVDSCTLTRALATAVAAGKIDVVTVLLDACEKSSISFAIETAAFTGQVAVVELLRSKCTPSSIRSAVTRAKAAGHDEVVQLLQAKRARLG